MSRLSGAAAIFLALAPFCVGAQAQANTAGQQPAPTKQQTQAGGSPAAKPANALLAKPPSQAKLPAKEIFGRLVQPVALPARAIGTYARGCLAGGAMLPVNGPAWQAMRLSRNRNWGHPLLVAYVEKLARDAKAKDGWPGLLVGDLAQPRGGPMLTGHASHQIGLDADIWLKPMPPRELTLKEREDISADSVVADDKVSLSPAFWQPGHVSLLKRAASYPEVARIFVHPAIKKGLCDAAGQDRGWLEKVRPWWGHNYHFHVRLHCPAGNAACVDQKPLPGGDGCGKEIDDWFRLLTRPKPDVPIKPAKPKPPLTMTDLPEECASVAGMTQAALQDKASARNASASPDEPAGEVLEPPPSE